MPFMLFESTAPLAALPLKGSMLIGAGRFWKALFFAMLLFPLLFALFYWYAHPVKRAGFSSYQPSPEWRYWLFKVAVTAAVSASAFKVLAWAMDIPSYASSDAVLWHGRAQTMSVIAPLIVALAAVSKALFHVVPRSGWKWTWGEDWKIKWIAISGIPAIAAFIWLLNASDFYSLASAGDQTTRILTVYREMHWESGLSLVPTLFFSSLPSSYGRFRQAMVTP
jgi:hypothetical protein